MEARSDTQPGFSAVAPPGAAAVRPSEWLLLLGAGLGLVTSNPLLTAGCFASRALVLRLTLRPGEPPVMASILGLLWIQSAIQVLSADLSGVPLWETSVARGIEQAVALSLLWVVVISIGRQSIPPDFDLDQHSGREVHRFRRDLHVLPRALERLMYGFGCRWLLGMSRRPALAFGLAAAVFLPQGTLELTTVKLLGGHITLLGLAVLLWKFFGARFEAWVYGDAETAGAMT